MEIAEELWVPSGTLEDVARMLYTLGRRTFVCVSVSQNRWYQFRDHGWHPLERPDGLIQLLIDCLSKKIAAVAGSADERAPAFVKLLHNIRTSSYVDKLLRDAAYYFYQEGFESQLDSSPGLILFRNGVYEIATGQLREGQREDRLSLSTGYDYKTFDVDSREMQQVKEFLQQIFPDEELRQRMLGMMANYLRGHLPNDPKMAIWQGVTGSAGVSSLLHLLELTMGQYHKSVPDSLLREMSPKGDPILAYLQGVRLISINNVQGGLMDPDSVRGLLSIDQIKTRKLYHDPIQYKKMFQIVLTDCHQWNDVHADLTEKIPFQRQFTDKPDPLNLNEMQKDPHMFEKLEQLVQPFCYLLLTSQQS